MSQVCTILLDCSPSGKEELKGLLVDLAKKSGWGVYFDYPTEFPHSENFIIDLSDDFEYPNCERLLTLDECIYYGKLDEQPFAERMLYVRDVILILLQKKDKISLFIGVSSNLLSDYELAETTGADIYNELLKHNDYRYPSVHYVIRKD